MFTPEDTFVRGSRGCTQPSYYPAIDAASRPDDQCNSKRVPGWGMVAVIVVAGLGAGGFFGYAILCAAACTLLYQVWLIIRDFRA
jgi:hypothetical protein